MPIEVGCADVLVLHRRVCGLLAVQQRRHEQDQYDPLLANIPPETDQLAGGQGKAKTSVEPHTTGFLLAAKHPLVCFFHLIGGLSPTELS